MFQMLYMHANMHCIMNTWMTTCKIKQARKLLNSKHEQSFSKILIKTNWLDVIDLNFY